MNKYDASLRSLQWDRGDWSLGSRTIPTSYDQITYFNVDGMISYTDFELEDLSILVIPASISSLRNAIRSSAVFVSRTLYSSLTRAAVVATSRPVADGARLQGQFGIAVTMPF